MSRTSASSIHPFSEGTMHRKCARFLRYLRNTWLSGMYKNLWCKWKKFEMRTTNLAEAFHSSLQKVLNCDHPPLSTLIRVLKDLDLEAKCALYRAERMPLECKHLRRRDLLRREKPCGDDEFRTSPANGATVKSPSREILHTNGHICFQ